MRDVIARRREGRGEDHVPFIDNLLQSGVDEDQASITHCLISTIPSFTCSTVQAINDALTFMVSGFHTSGNFIIWLLWYLASHPEVQERVREEIAKETEGERGDKLKAYSKDVATTFNTSDIQLYIPTQYVHVVCPELYRKCHL